MRMRILLVHVTIFCALKQVSLAFNSAPNVLHRAQVASVTSLQVGILRDSRLIEPQHTICLNRGRVHSRGGLQSQSGRDNLLCLNDSVGSQDSGGSSSENDDWNPDSLRLRAESNEKKLRDWKARKKAEREGRNWEQERTEENWQRVVEEGMVPPELKLRMWKAKAAAARQNIPWNPEETAEQIRQEELEHLMAAHEAQKAPRTTQQEFVAPPVADASISIPVRESLPESAEIDMSSSPTREPEVDPSLEPTLVETPDRSELSVEDGEEKTIPRKDPGDALALVLAAKRGKPNGVKVLIQLGAKINAAKGDDGRTALHEAAALGHLDVVRLLLEQGADKTIKDFAGKTPEDLAMDMNRKEITALFDS